MKYVKKQVVIDAEIYDGKNNPFDVIVMKELGGGYKNPQPVIETLEGSMIVNVGDYIIKEPFDRERGFYPCKPDIFLTTYEEVNE